MRGPQAGTISETDTPARATKYRAAPPHCTIALQSRPPPAHPGSHGNVHSMIKARMCKGALVLEQLAFVHFSVSYFSGSSSKDK